MLDETICMIKCVGKGFLHNFINEYTFFYQYQPRSEQIVDKKSVPILQPKVVNDQEVLEKDVPKIKEEISTKIELEKDKPDIVKEGKGRIHKKE